MNRYSTKKNILLLLAIIISISNVAAQTNPPVPKDSSYYSTQLDLIGIAEKIFSIKPKAKSDSESLKPGKLLLSFIPTPGYTLEAGLLVVVAINASFYTANYKNTSLSVLTIGLQYSLNHQVVVPIVSDVWLKKDKLHLLGDWRYYQYPSYTYGLGGNTSIYKTTSVNYSLIRFKEELLGHIYSHFYAGLGYLINYHWNITGGNDQTDFQQYNDGAVKTTSSGPMLHITYDTRKNINNPKNEFYGSIEYHYNSTLLGSDENWQYVDVEFRKYIRLKSSPYNILAFWNWNVATFGGKAPYFDLPSNGWDTYANTGRGYIQGRFRGTDLVYLEGEDRFALTKNGLLGGVVFVNATSVPEWPSNQFQKINPAAGAGIRIKFNKYSDTNFCIDYGVGIGGSRGVFFNLGEVF